MQIVGFPANQCCQLGVLFFNYYSDYYNIFDKVTLGLINDKIIILNKVNITISNKWQRSSNLS